MISAGEEKDAFRNFEFASSLHCKLTASFKIPWV
jgi:hypothetical protein